MGGQIEALCALDNLALFVGDAVGSIVLAERGPLYEKKLAYLAKHPDVTVFLPTVGVTSI